MTIVCFEHKFIFIKTKKTGSTSVEAFLRRFTGAGDVVTYLTPRDEKWCADQGWCSRNYAADRDVEREYVSLCQSGRFDDALKFIKGVECDFVNHMSADDVKLLVEQRGYRWSDFYSFTIDRHPYSWLLSVLLYDNFTYNATGECANDLSDINKRAISFIRNCDFSKRLNFNLYSAQGQLLVNKVMHYERLYEDLARVLPPLVGDVDLSEFPFLKKNAEHLSPLDIFEAETLNLLRHSSGKAMKLAGYEL